MTAFGLVFLTVTAPIPPDGQATGEQKRGDEGG
jgi:hypothetical protein